MEVQTKIVSVTGDEPVSSTVVKNYIKVDFATDDDLINIQIKAARELCENYCSSTFVKTTRQALFSMDFDEFRNGLRLDLPYAPVDTIVSVKSVAADGTETALTSSEYSVCGLEDKYIVIGQASISISQTAAPSYLVEYTAGYDNDEVPSQVVDAILQTVGEIYEHRQNQVVGESVGKLSFNSTDKLMPFRKSFFI